MTIEMCKKRMWKKMIGKYDVNPAKTKQKYEVNHAIVDLRTSQKNVRFSCL